MTKVTPDHRTKTKLYTQLMLHKYINIPISFVVRDFVYIQLLPTPLHIVTTKFYLSVLHIMRQKSHISCEVRPALYTDSHSPQDAV